MDHMILLIMNIETGSEPRGLWRLQIVHRLVGLHREAGVPGSFHHTKVPCGTKTLV